MSNDVPPLQRFLTLKQAAEELNTGTGVLRGLVRRGDLPAIQVGGRGQWRIERRVLEDFIRHAYGLSRTESGIEGQGDPGRGTE